MPMRRGANPFKKTGSAAKSTPGQSTNLLGHLTGKAIGFNSPSSNGGDSHREWNDSANISGISAMVNGEENGENNENQSKNGTNSSSSTPSGMKFMPWFEINRSQLKEENPNATDSELIKIGMKQFKTLNSGLTPRGTGEKRKLEDSEESGSGVSKLARFGFVKN